MWNKTDTAKFLRISTNGLDGYVANGCPVERGNNGHVKGFYVGDVLEWMRQHTSQSVRERAAEATSRYIGAIITKGTFASVDFRGILENYGLDPTRSEMAWGEVTEVAGRSLGVVTSCPPDYLSGS